MITVYEAIVKKICKVRFNIDVRKYFVKSSHRQMEQFGPGHC